VRKHNFSRPPHERYHRLLLGYRLLSYGVRGVFALRVRDIQNLEPLLLTLVVCTVIGPVLGRPPAQVFDFWRFLTGSEHLSHPISELNFGPVFQRFYLYLDSFCGQIGGGKGIQPRAKSKDEQEGGEALELISRLGILD